MRDGGPTANASDTVGSKFARRGYKGLKRDAGKVVTALEAVVNCRVSLFLFWLSILNLYYFPTTEHAFSELKQISIYKFSSQINKMF